MLPTAGTAQMGQAHQWVQIRNGSNREWDYSKFRIGDIMGIATSGTGGTQFMHVALCVDDNDTSSTGKARFMQCGGTGAGNTIAYIDDLDDYYSSYLRVHATYHGDDI